MAEKKSSGTGETSSKPSSKTSDSGIRPGFVDQRHEVCRQEQDRRQGGDADGSQEQDVCQGGVGGQVR